MNQSDNIFVSRTFDLNLLDSIKIIISDLDGTLVTPENKDIIHNVEELNTIVKKLLKHNQKFILATGRTLKGIHNIIKSMSLENTPIILYNGSVVLKGNNYKIIFKAVFNQEIVRIFRKEFNSISCQILFYCYLGPPQNIPPILLKPDDCEKVIGWSNIETFNRDINNLNIKWYRWGYYRYNDQPSAILIKAKDLSSFSKILEILRKIEQIDFTFSGSGFIEVRPKGSNKYNAIRKVKSLNKFSLNEIMSIGDNDNDVELITNSGIGIAVQNSSDLLKEKAKYITYNSSFLGAFDVLRLVNNYNAKKRK